MRSAEELAALVPQLARAHVSCIGDVMLDRFVYGQVERISPEAPVPVLKVNQDLVVLGGLGNVARNISTLGAKVSVVSVTGQDQAGREIRQLLTDLPGCTSSLFDVPNHPSTIKTRCIASSQQLVRIDREALLQVSDELLQKLVADAVGQADSPVLVLSDYGKGILSGRNAQEILSAAIRAGKRVIIDPKGTDYSRYRGAHLITPNRSELHLATRMPVNTNEEIIAAAQSLIDQFDLGAVIATLSERGVMVVQRDLPPLHLPSEAREVFDVSGAGDTVVATLACAMAVGIPLVDAAHLANRAAAVVVGKIGTAAISSSELVRALRVEEVSQLEEKFVDLPQALEQIRLWRRAGDRIGFTNGCFDLLHPGHVTLLAQSAAKVDRLIVGLNSDASVQRLKGPTRPVQHETARGIVLAGLSSVDLVVLFGEDTPLELIRAVRPDVLIKGADYKVEDIVGAEDVQHYGGEVVLINLVPQQSTTRLVQRIHGSSSVT